MLAREPWLFVHSQRYYERQGGGGEVEEVEEGLISLVAAGCRFIKVILRSIYHKFSILFT